jgi:EAL domain-containing protein (putative c-di-GMP-specific phosphodiesterase class I)
LDGEDILVFGGHALSTAKSRDNEDVVWLTQELIDAIAGRKKLESDIQAGLKNGEFRPYYQPKVNARTGKLCGAEALSRWHHNGEVLYPDGYISVMEANDAVCQMDFCILASVCEDISEWLRSGISVPKVSVNFSRRNLTDPKLAAHIDEVVTSAGIPKNLIEIEVTESSDEFTIGVLGRFVESLHKLGYKVSIDDFGNASSSLTLLREVPFDTLKIDKGFVDHDNAKDITILTYIIKMAHDIHLDIVAEGVEQKAQIDILSSLGVDVIQGFYFDRPLSKEAMTERLKASEYTL